MASLATIFDRFFAARELAAAPRDRGYETYPNQVRAFPNEDVYFFIKKIDNTRVVRALDPAAPGICWRLIGSSVAAAVLLIGILLPSLYGLVAGYRLESLRQEKQRLDVEASALQLEETKLLSPARLEELARRQQFVDPAPEKVIYLEGKPEGTLARR
jgi:cell division protein FtsL